MSEYQPYGVAQKITEYKNKVINRIFENKELCKLLYYNEPDALFKPDVENPKKTLMYKSVFPYRFVPDIVDNQQTYLTLGVGRLNNSESGFKVYNDYRTLMIYIYFFTHVDLMRTSVGVRQDFMLGEIDKLFNRKKESIGMGDTPIGYVSELWSHNNKFGGYATSYNITDLKE
jgi:hypothetical protein